MKVGDLVIRRCKTPHALRQRTDLGSGIVLSKHVHGNPPHPCVNVFYGKAGKSWLIAESLMELINESR